ncbi:hypothetical protein IPL85_02710 [Candidatus Saccharibacteria bacterium]|nr:MAG: hypothetical protein IPL85_02710 [Candidatus Saccharibacteria bacterium]
MRESLTSVMLQLERGVKVTLRDVDIESVPRDQREYMAKLKHALNEIRLDVRDYEYAETRDEQLRWAKIGQHNLRVLNTLILRLDSVFGPADVAEIGARIDFLQTALV